MTELPARQLQLQSTITKGGELRLELVEVPTPELRDQDVLVRVEASPINPSDLGLLFGVADMSTARATGTDQKPEITADVPEKVLGAMAGRLDQAMPVGNEGCGVVVATGSDEAAQALLGKTVAILGGAMYSQYRATPAAGCLVLPDGTDPAAGASCFVNPLTALGMVETMQREGHSALVHTAAASNLGQMLQKICLADGIDLVNIVRREEQAQVLRDLGAKHVCDSSAETFRSDLARALAQSGATLAFDAIGGGRLASDILAAMEVAASQNADTYSRYGSTVHKQVYIYGGLDRGPTELRRAYGMAWGIGGWLLPIFLDRVGPEVGARMRQRVANELHTTFASSYAREISLFEALDLDNIAIYGKQATGEKFLVRPNKGL